ncbi:uncharacterized protein isoform X2 [Choristoneura fumiferana]|uniref:uncharacterized protein isoform X2 n=1 Tax=Choristoneura fumiferana TaxID=7141 RepID=UPI003D158B88
MMSFAEDGELYPASSGAIRFQVKCTSGVALLALCNVKPPHKELFKIILGGASKIQQAHNHCHDIIDPVNTEFIDFTVQHQEFWITWFGGVIHVGFGDQTNPFMWCNYVREENVKIGYIKFNKKHLNRHTRTVHFTDWIYEESPIALRPTKFKKINGGDLRWVPLNAEIDHRVPADALIGGFEKEPLYIARAHHNGSLCPGKYVVSLRRAFLPWGRREHQKTRLEILCGYNAAWVKTEGAKIPQNAFIAGTSEVRQEPLYIGRAEHDGCLINGKIHVIHGTCFLPYYGEEIVVYSYEILVVPDVNFRGTLADVACTINL